MKPSADEYTVNLQPCGGVALGGGLWGGALAGGAGGAHRDDKIISIVESGMVEFTTMTCALVIFLDIA